jgi:Secretion system C-terminal sorting domain
MKRILFVLVLSLMLLSFGQSYAVLTFSTGVSGAAVYNGNRINPGTNAFSIDISAASTDTPNRITWSSPFLVTGTNIASVAWDPDTAHYVTPTFAAFWDLFKTPWDASWDGDLTNDIGNGIFGDLFNYTGVGNNVGMPGDGVSYLAIQLKATGITLGGAADSGIICVGQGDAPNDVYDWIFDDPQPTMATDCYVVKVAPNFPPSFTAGGAVCPLQKTVQWHQTVTASFTAVDVETDPITYSKAGGVGTVTAGGGFTYQPTCQDVGQSLNVDVFAADAFHPVPPGDAVQHCVMNIVVQNTAPVIPDDSCGKTLTVGLAGGSAAFTATDVNTGDTKNWSFTPNDGRITTTNVAGVYTLIFTPVLADLGNDFTYTVRVTDCAGDFDECDVTFHTVRELPYTIKIQKVENALQGHHSLVEVVKTAGSEDMLGFDFLIAYDASALTFMGADGGVLFDIPGVYEWEYFTYRFGPNGNCGSGCPTGLLRVIGLAEQNNGPHQALELTIPDGTVLFTLDFLVSNDRTLECQYVPIRFFWMDCGDNTIAYNPSTAGNPNVVITAISRYVFEFWGTEITANAGFPTYQGAPNICDTPDDTVYVDNEMIIKPGTVRFIDFWNGGIDIVCADSIDLRGDVNLNGLANEIGDAVVFTNYFIKGLAAFTVNVEGQIAATDVNADGIALSVADLVYLIRVIVGDVMPYAKLSPYANTANFGFNGDVVTVDAVLGAAYFVFNGTADVSLGAGASNMTLLTGTLNGNTVALVYSMDKGATCTGAILNTNGTVKSVDAVDYFGSSYKVGMLPTAFSISNYPNPFNPVTNIELMLPVASDWTVSIYNVAGQKVAGFNGYSNAGKQVVTWDASNVASGIYFYKAEAGKYSATKKMVLMK